jgi:hypothetical protein
MMRMYHAETKRALLELVVRSAPAEEKRFEIVQHVPPAGWAVRFGEGWSLHAVAVALGVEKVQEREEKLPRSVSRLTKPSRRAGNLLLFR